MTRNNSTLDLFGNLIIPEILSELCYSEIPELTKDLQICLTGYFACARGNTKRVQAMQQKLSEHQVSVTENWNNKIELLVVGDHARLISLKIKKSITHGIPIVKESELLAKVNFMACFMR
jgi:NAD-dependent DNA ligase